MRRDINGSEIINIFCMRQDLLVRSPISSFYVPELLENVSFVECRSLFNYFKARKLGQSRGNRYAQLSATSRTCRTTAAAPKRGALPPNSIGSALTRSSTPTYARVHVWRIRVQSGALKPYPHSRGHIEVMRITWPLTHGLHD